MKKFQDLNTGSKLAIGFSTLCLLMIVISLIGFIQIDKLSSETKILYEHPLSVSNAVRDINISIRGMNRSLRNIILAENTKQIDSLSNLVNNSKEHAESSFDIVFNRYLGNMEDVVAAHKLFYEWVPIYEETINLKIQGKTEDAFLLTRDKGDKNMALLQSKLEVISGFAQKKAETLYANVVRIQERGRFIFLFASLFILFISLVIIFLISKSISSPILQFISESKRIFSGSDVLTEVKINSEKSLYETTVAELKAAYNKIRQTNNRLKSYNEVLEKKVNERTKELQEKQHILEESNQEFQVLNEEYLAQNEEFQVLNQELYIKNEALTESLEKIQHINYELKSAKDKAEESDKLKSAFLANMSHEIRTPLNAILGFSNLLGESDINEIKKDDCISIINNSGERLLQIINDIIDISKLEAGQLDIFPGRCDVAQVIREAVETLRFSQQSKNKPGLKIQYNIPSNLTPLYTQTDSLRLRQVIDNLIINAIKYSERGIVEAGFSVKQNEGKQFVEFYISDTGIGIPEEKYPIIFERFRQVEENNYHEGTGLGLSISKGIIELLGGKIWFKSQKDEGSTFFFTIPYITVEEKKHVHPTSEETINISLEGKTVVIAEDNFDSFLLLKKLLEKTKATIIHAENGKELLEKIDKVVPDLILLDINMPVMDGFESLKEIQKKGYDCPVIAQTAYIMSDEYQKCINAGCNAYISKPINRKQLLQTIHSVMKN